MSVLFYKDLENFDIAEPFFELATIYLTSTTHFNVSCNYSKSDIIIESKNEMDIAYHLTQHGFFIGLSANELKTSITKKLYLNRDVLNRYKVGLNINTIIKHSEKISVPSSLNITGRYESYPEMLLDFQEAIEDNCLAFELEGLSILDAPKLFKLAEVPVSYPCANEVYSIFLILSHNIYRKNVFCNMFYDLKKDILNELDNQLSITGFIQNILDIKNLNELVSDLEYDPSRVDFEVSYSDELIEVQKTLSDESLIFSKYFWFPEILSTINSSFTVYLKVTPNVPEIPLRFRKAILDVYEFDGGFDLFYGKSGEFCLTFSLLTNNVDYDPSTSLLRLSYTCLATA